VRVSEVKFFDFVPNNGGALMLTRNKGSTGFFGQIGIHFSVYAVILLLMLILSTTFAFANTEKMSTTALLTGTNPTRALLDHGGPFSVGINAIIPLTHMSGFGIINSNVTDFNLVTAGISPPLDESIYFGEISAQQFTVTVKDPQLVLVEISPHQTVTGQIAANDAVLNGKNTAWIQEQVVIATPSTKHYMGLMVTSTTRGLNSVLKVC